MIPAPTKQPPHSRKAKVSAKRPQNDRPTPAPLPLSQREQQVCEYLSQRMSFEAIANHLNLSPAAAREYHRRALDKRQRMSAPAPLEQGDCSTAAEPELAVAKVPCDRPSVEAPVLVERPNAIDLCVSSLFVMGKPFTTWRSLNPQTTISELPRHPFRRKTFSRLTRRTGVGFRVALAS